ncbi:hypothetical protein HDU96_000683 [Phlyctochytrium bullatum]|nr:hypothetical protein HDU96_000683 [Phlyctochytrium bullatum]
MAHSNNVADLTTTRPTQKIKPLLLLFTLAALSTSTLAQTPRSTAECLTANQLLCKVDCGAVVIRCSGPGQGTEFTLQGSGSIKCFMRNYEPSRGLAGYSADSFVISTSCTPSTGAAAGRPAVGGGGGATAAATDVDPTPRLCGALDNATTPEVEAELVRTSRVISKRLALAQFQRSVSTSFRVFFHVVFPTDGHPARLSRDAINAQIDRLNQDFRTYKFQLADSPIIPYLQVFYYRNALWFDRVNQNVAGSPFQQDMKTRTRRGGSRDLNVWTVGFTAYGALLGYSTFPNEYAARPWNDGVVIHFATLPGGTMRNFNMGRTLVHETGHWLGLQHTFQGGCTGKGDGVEDTPAERSGATGCPIGRDTCPGGGPDPINK